MKNLLLTALLALCTCTTATAQCRDFDCAYREAKHNATLPKEYNIL
jgi:hypothetical protein